VSRALPLAAPGFYLTNLLRIVEVCVLLNRTHEAKRWLVKALAVSPGDEDDADVPSKLLALKLKLAL
jgi:hypothetical protein